MTLINGDCLEEMKDMSDNSIDFLFADLPYGQTSCKWDCLIDLDLFWKQVNRVCKQEAVMAFTCSVKFGNSLINSNPKCFRYDLIWVKSAACGFLNAKKMPMKKHEMVYIFYRKLPKVYTENIALHHTHKFLKETENKRNGKDGIDNKGMVKNRSKTEIVNKYDPPLPNSVIKEEIYGKEYLDKKTDYNERKNGESRYNPPLPNSVIKEETFIRGKNKSSTKNDVYNSDERFNSGKLYHHDRKLQKGDDPIYDPPLPNSVIKEENVVVETNHNTLYGNIDIPNCQKRKDGESRYTPPLPNSVIKEEEAKGNNIYNKFSYYNNGEKGYEPPLPNSVIKEENEVIKTNLYSSKTAEKPRELYRNEGGQYTPPLPNTILEIKSEKGKHATQKPIPLMEWLIKYYTREGDVVLDPTMGSGGTGIACKNLNREFIGIEKDEEIYKVAVERNIDLNIV